MYIFLNEIVSAKNKQDKLGRSVTLFT